MFMTANPETVSTSDSLAFALHKMDVGGYRHLPVIHHGAPVGVVSVRDMLRHITRLCREAGAMFIVNGAAPPANSLLTSAGAEFHITSEWSFAAKFDGEFASGSRTYAGTGTFRYAW